MALQPNEMIQFSEYFSCNRMNSTALLKIKTTPIIRTVVFGHPMNKSLDVELQVTMMYSTVVSALTSGEATT